VSASRPSLRSRTLAPDYSSEIDIELLTFIERYATNLARWDVLLFFGRNPGTRDNVSAIAKQLGRRPQSLVKELDDLAFLGVLHVHQNGNGMIYQLARATTTRRAVIRLAQHFDRPRAATN
jgi:DNA-binding MarR family transcriptional regulator